MPLNANGVRNCSKTVSFFSCPSSPSDTVSFLPSPISHNSSVFESRDILFIFLTFRPYCRAEEKYTNKGESRTSTSSSAGADEERGEDPIKVSKRGKISLEWISKKRSNGTKSANRLLIGCMGIKGRANGFR